MIADIANFSLSFALFSCVLAAFTKPYTKILSITTAATIIFSFLSLVYLFIVSDFSVLAVYKYSHTLKPLIYKISGTWGNHEGSMLMLALVNAIFNVCFMFFSSFENERKLSIIRIHLIIMGAFLAFILFTSNPFEGIYPTPPDGMGLNPLLQDIALAIHPPVLYMGYGGVTLLFSASLASMLRGGLPIKGLKNLALTSWVFLSAGIALGSWWAYRELGWGGFWFWDPVENVSLMPWICVTALVHSLIIYEKRGLFYNWTIFLGLISFIMSLIGIFLVRSGVLTSVHAFASDPARGIFILVFLCTVSFTAFYLFARNAMNNIQNHPIPPLSRESFMFGGNLILVVLCLVVLLGTVYPLFLEVITGDKISVGAPYFNHTFNIIALPLFILIIFSPYIAWAGGGFKGVKNTILPFIAAALSVSFVLFFASKAPVLNIITIFLSLWLIFDNIVRFKKREKKSRGFIAMVTGHIAISVIAIGIAGSTGFNLEKEQIMKKNDIMQIANYNLIFNDIIYSNGKNYIFRRGIFKLWSGNKELADLKPETRLYPVEETNTTEPDIYYTLFSNFYIALGDGDENGNFMVRVYTKPMINLIWFGVFMLVFAGVIGIKKPKA